MPSDFLKERYVQFFSEAAGEQSVYYYAFNADSADSLTGEIDEATAYSTDGIEFPAIIEHNPSKAAREKIGLEIDFQALIKIPTQEITDAGATLKIGDYFILPGDDSRFYVQKVASGKQYGGYHLDYIIALGRKLGRRPS